VTARRPWAALATVWGLVALAEAWATERPPPATPGRAADAGASTLQRLDGGRGQEDGGVRLAPLSSEDVEVVENLELLEHLLESDYLELLELAPDQ
jgi:hypothetical protein